MGSREKVSGGDADIFRIVTPRVHGSEPKKTNQASKVSIPFITIRQPSGKRDVASGSQVRSHVMTRVHRQRQIKELQARASKKHKQKVQTALPLHICLCARAPVTESNRRKSNLNGDDFSGNQAPTGVACPEEGTEKPSGAVLLTTSIQKPVSILKKPIGCAKCGGSLLQSQNPGDNSALTRFPGSTQTFLEKLVDPFVTTGTPSVYSSRHTHELLHYCKL